MPEAKKLKFLFAINPISGGHDKSAWESGIRTFFEQQPHSADLFLLRWRKNDDIELPKRIESYQPDRLVAVGGDGTIKFVAEHAMNASLPLGILPAGFGQRHGQRTGYSANAGSQSGRGGQRGGESRST
jgi:diacylglycerol kinase (ATP)